MLVNSALRCSSSVLAVVSRYGGRSGLGSGSALAAEALSTGGGFGVARADSPGCASVVECCGMRRTIPTAKDRTATLESAITAPRCFMLGIRSLESAHLPAPSAVSRLPPLCRTWHRAGRPRRASGAGKSARFAGRAGDLRTKYGISAPSAFGDSRAAGGAQAGLVRARLAPRRAYSELCRAPPADQPRRECRASRVGRREADVVFRHGSRRPRSLPASRGRACLADRAS